MAKVAGIVGSPRRGGNTEGIVGGNGLLELEAVRRGPEPLEKAFALGRELVGSHVA